jgi:hypothetical protein
MAFAAAEKSAATRRAYSADWADFATWCALRGASPLPAHQSIVAAYLSHLANTGRKASPSAAVLPPLATAIRPPAASRPPMPRA